MKYTMEQIREIARCSNDIEYFADRYIYLNNADGKEKMILNDEQREIIKDFSSIKSIKKKLPRQSGKSVVGLIILLHRALFGEYSNHVIITQRNYFGADLLSKLMYMYNSLPSFMKITKVMKKNRSSIEYDNGSRIMIKSSVESFRGISLNTVYIDEYNFMKDYVDWMKTIIPLAAGNETKILSLSS